jgi:type I restriction enzyme, S subunit
MPGERREATFQQLLDEGMLEIGDGYRAQNNELGGTGPIFLRAGHVTDSHIDFAGVEHFHEHLADRVRPKMSKVGDTIITTKGNSTGRTSFVTDRLPPFVYSPHLSYWRSRDPKKLCGGFLRYWSQGVEFMEQLSGMKASTDMAPYLSLTDQRRLSITLPPLAEQKAIAAVLGALDDKIELNRRMNATLEAMARALFQSWFVDFDPVRAKLDGRPPAALDPETAGLFPEHLEDSPLGHIPRGWTAQRLPDAVEVNPRRTLKSGTIAPYVDMKNLPTQGHSAEEVIDREFSSGTKFQNGDSLLARITPCLENGKTGYVDFLEDGQVGWGSTEYIVLAPKPPLPPQFGYLLARSDALRTHAIQNMTGTSGRQRVPSECFNTFWLAVPPPDIARRFDELTAPLMAKIKAIATESRTLATLRDTLLPKLLSGELSVTKAIISSTTE